MRFEDLDKETQQELVKRRKIYEEYMTKYKHEHQCCPKCGGTQYGTTLVAYIFDHDNPEGYKDENMCNCMGCGDRHIRHDRVPKQR